MKIIPSHLKCLFFLVLLCLQAQAMYDPGQGRWISRDPIGELGGVNLYGMVSNNPLTNMDLLGMIEAEVHSETCSKDGATEVKDAAGQQCCKCRLSILELRVESPDKPARDQVAELLKQNIKLKDILGRINTGHAFLWFTDSKTGRGFTAQSRAYTDIIGLKPGKVIIEATTGAAKAEKSYELCPSTRKKIVDSIKKSTATPPKYLYSDRVLGDDKAQCATWALDMLVAGGIPASIPKTGAEPWDLAHDAAAEPNPKP